MMAANCHCHRDDVHCGDEDEDGDDEDGDIHQELGPIEGETAKVNGEPSAPHGEPLQVGHLSRFQFVAWFLDLVNIFSNHCNTKIHGLKNRQFSDDCSDWFITEQNSSHMVVIISILHTCEKITTKWSLLNSIVYNVNFSNFNMLGVWASRKA